MIVARPRPRGRCRRCRFGVIGRMTMPGRDHGPLTRRAVMLGAATAMAGAFLAACGGASAPSKPAEPTKPAAAPAATTVPAVKPAEPTKPAAAAGQPTSAAPAAKMKAELRLHVRTGSEEDTLKEMLPKFATDT